MAKKMRVHSGGKHKVMSALASVSGLGELGAARSKHSKDYRKMRYEIDLKPKDLLSTDKLITLAVAKAAIDQLKADSGVGLTSDERREIERAVSSVVAGKKFNKSTSGSMGFNIDVDTSKGIGTEAVVISQGSGAEAIDLEVVRRDGMNNIVVCPNKFDGLGPVSASGASRPVKPATEKARNAGRYAAQVLYSLLDTGLTTKRRKVKRLNKETGNLEDRIRLFLGPTSGSIAPKMELGKSACYRIEVDKSTQAKAFSNMFLSKTSTASSAFQTDVANLINTMKTQFKVPGYAEVSQDVTGEDLNGLGQIEDAEDVTLDGVRRRKGRKRKSAARKSPARRRKSSSKRKASRRRKK